MITEEAKKRAEHRGDVVAEYREESRFAWAHSVCPRCASDTELGFCGVALMHCKVCGRCWTRTT